MSSPVQPGRILAGKYRVERTLGVGGMGVVVAATHLALEQRVAIKFLLPEALASADVVARFAREARAAVKIQSEHVARVIDVGTLESGAPYMVMEYLDGSDLSGALKANGAFRIDYGINFLLQACEAIAEAHAAGIVHRDLKPQNLFLSKRADGSPIVKVLDFGISKTTGTGEAHMTKTTAIMGSPFYMSPEQLKSSRNVDARSDVWSLGVILHEILTGNVPFSAETMPQLCGVILSEPPPPLREVRPDAPEGLELAIKRALEKDVDKRFANVAEFAMAIAPYGTAAAVASAERIARIIAPGSPMSLVAPGALAAPVSLAPPPPQGGGASTSTAWAGSGASVPAPAPGGATMTSSPQPKSGGGAKIAIALSAVVLLGGGAVLFAMRGASAPTAEATQPAAAPPAPSSAAAATTAAPAAELVDVKITATPAEAKLFLDDAALPSNPYAARMKPDGTGHRIRVEAPGFATQNHYVVFDKAVALNVTLQAEAAGAKPAPGGNAAKPAATAPTPAGRRKIDTADPYQ